MKKNKRSVGVVAGALLIGSLGAIPAHAEAWRDTYISDWHIGNESKRWADSNRDAAHTAVRFSGCSTDTEEGFKWASIEVYKDVFGPDEGQGNKINYCSTSNWGRLGKGDYYFDLNGMRPGGTLHVKSVRISY